MKKEYYSLSSIKKAYNESEDVGFYKYSIARFFFRPLSFYGAWIFLRLGITPNQTTIISWLAVLLGCFLYIFIPPSSSWVPISLILFWAILDYMDGSMARVTNSRSKYGHFIDVVGAYFMLAFLPICMGIGLYYYPDHSLNNAINAIGFSYIVDNSVILIFGAFASLNNILLRLIIMRANETFGTNLRSEEGELKGYYARISIWVEALMSPRGLFFPLLIVLHALNQLELFVICYFLFYSAALIIYILKYLKKSP
jgi:phosphatidylglycerophosphate synthase